MGIRSKLRAVFIAMAVVLVVTVVATYWIGLEVIQSNRDVIGHQSAIKEILEAQSTVTDAETGQRGYLLTQDPKYLDPYNRAVARIHEDLDDLHRLAGQGELSQSDVDEFVRLANAKLSELELTISTRRDKGIDAAVALVKTGQGEVYMDNLRRQAKVLLDRENAELQAAEASMNRKTRIRSFSFAGVCIANLAFILWCYRRLQREMAVREASASEILRQRELLNVTLASIGDAVIVTDMQSRITFFNEVAEQLTGWKSHEARGMACAQIFKIINEESRAPVQSPVEKVLASGSIVGLANHTLLIRKDGAEIPIDDSGAPIRESDGTLRGVVLVFRDFSDHKAAEKKLIDAKKDLEAANKAKDQFLATLSHELRTPLTPVLATLTTWESHEAMPPALIPDIQMLRRNVELEARLIDDLLDLTRIVRGKLTLNLEPSDIHELIEAVVGIYQSEIQSRSLHVSMRLDAAQHFASADPARVQQVMWNVLKNATKFSNEGGSIDISTTNIDGQLQLTIRDSGIGMNEQTLARLFRPFEQGDEEIVRKYGGLGLGMAISKALVSAQGGTIAATSEGAGRGSTFTITFPAVDPKAFPAVKDSQPAPPARGNRKLLKILLVEDHPDTAMVMSRLLRRLGHEVATSNTVASAMQTATSNNFDLMISDIGLPDGTGIDLIRQLRPRMQIPAIALTGFGMDEDVAKCRDAGFTAHLTKPVNFQKLEMLMYQLAGK